jgi:hypothetical protein
MFRTLFAPDSSAHADVGQARLQRGDCKTIAGSDVHDSLSRGAWWLLTPAMTLIENVAHLIACSPKNWPGLHLLLVNAGTHHHAR